MKRNSWGLSHWCFWGPKNSTAKELGETRVRGTLELDPLLLILEFFVSIAFGLAILGLLKLFFSKKSRLLLAANRFLLSILKSWRCLEPFAE